MMPPEFWFWFDIAFAVLWCGWAVWFARRGWRWHTALSAVMMCVMIFSAWVFSDTVFGECAGKRGTTVPFHDGMTLCPGQTATFTIVIPIDPGAPLRAPVRERGL